jgi:Putative metal-binding motif
MYTLLLVLIGCPPEKPVGLDTSLPDSSTTDDSGDSGTDDSVTAPDSDGDGTPDDEDCAPDDPAIHPEAAEVCDGIDQDCDGTADNGLLETLYADGDGDGYGAGAASESCPAAGLSSSGDDCDDADSAVSPGADEVCDGIDNDCSGGTDEGLTGTLYPDVDGDGWGESGGAGTVGCLDTPGMVNNDGDCDDGNPFAYPGQLERLYRLVRRQRRRWLGR